MNHLLQKTIISLFSYFLFLVSFLSCEKTTAPVTKLQLTLSAEYVGVTEADLLLRTSNSEANTQYQLFRDDSLISDGALIQAETIITDTRLLPAHHYSYQSFLIKDQKRIAQSEARQVNTLDTTSHNYTWQTFTFGGEAGSCVLYDCAILSEDNIWCAGAIYLKDSLGNPDFNAYNAVHWDGQQWEMKRIPTNSVVGLGFYPINTVFAFDADNIWMFSDAGSYCHWNGTTWQSQYVAERQGGINKIWGSSPTDLYFVGTNGNITYYNGQSWQKLESPAGAGGTDFDFQDIWGEVDLSNGQNKILAVACNRFTNDGSAVVRITGNTINLVQGAGLPSNISGVWSADGREWYICGDGLFKSRDLTKPWQEIAGQPLIYKLCIRGNGPNDIFVAGYLGLVSHWNGYSWHTYPQMPGHYPALAVKGDLVVAVGDISDGIVGGPATILMGRRNS
jgi:hypothetical protein